MSEETDRPVSTRADRYRDAERTLWTAHGVVPGERTVEMPDGAAPVRVQEIGSGAPLVFLHGASNAGTSWAPLVAGLTDHRCLVVDRPGCGLSAPLSDAHGDVDAFERFADRFLPALLDGLGIDRAPVVCTSVGGYLALRAAAADPGRISHVVAIGWTVGAPVGRLPLAMRVTALRTIGRLVSDAPPTPSSVRALFRQIGLRRTLDAGNISDEMLDWFLALVRDTDTMRNELTSGPDLVAPVRGPNTRLLLDDDLLARVDAAVGLQWGDADPFGSRDIVEDFAARLPGAELDVVPGAGHAPWLDDVARSDAFTRATLAR